MTRIPATMAACLLKGHGGTEMLEYREDVPVPEPGTGEVLVEVTATAKNNTDRKVREGLYVTSEDAEATSFQMSGEPSLQFPRIQGADIVGRVAAVGPGVDQSRVGERGLLDFNIYPDARAHINLAPDYYGHGADGGFAEYVVLPSDQFHHIDNPDLSDAELAALGFCSYQTALHMLQVAGVSAGENILVTGASGGVGTALIQLCRLLGAIPHAVSSGGCELALRELGAETLIDRTGVSDWPAAVNAATGGCIIDAVMDLAGGETTNGLLDVMIQRMTERRNHPRLAIAGASAGNITRILWTKIYLYQVQIFGVSHGTREDAEDLLAWIRSGKLRPVLHGTFPLSRLKEAEAYFASGRSRDYLGKVVIVPDAHWQQVGAPFAIEGTAIEGTKP